VPPRSAAAETKAQAGAMTPAGGICCLCGRLTASVLGRLPHVGYPWPLSRSSTWAARDSSSRSSSMSTRATSVLGMRRPTGRL
jgi:hypothetical protein